MESCADADDDVDDDEVDDEYDVMCIRVGVCVCVIRYSDLSTGSHIDILNANARLAG